MKILLVEDNENILSILKRGFSEKGYVIDEALNGKDAEYLATINNYNVIILDWMLPLKSGIEVLQSLRGKNIITPILILSAKDSIENKIQGLTAGCDDYLSKPFSFDELLARVEALHRRSILLSKKNFIEFSNIKIDIIKKIVYQDASELVLSSKEYSLLWLLIEHKNSFISKAMIEEMLWSNEKFINSNIIEVTIYNLRKKLGKEIIKNFRGLGYKIEI